ncbi:MAG: response regulator [Paludibacter sp.]|nr:response regulator [Paludibacter sp.]
MIDESAFDWSKYTILIAEDDECNFVLLKFMFLATKVNILRAENGVDAVTLCRSNQQIDLVLMDVKMPIMDGIEATRTIKSFRSNLPIIMQTAHILEEVKLNCYDAGCDEFFTKPFDEEKFYSVIETFFKR